jgi:type VI protein secretion system component Hcp
MKIPHHRWPRRVFAALAGWVAALAFPVSAEPALKLWLSLGPPIPGESADPLHTGWLDVQAASATGNPPLPGSTLTLRRRIDKASPLLMKACATGTHFPKVDLHVAKEAEGQPKLFWALTLTDVMVSSYQNSGEGGLTGLPALEDLGLVHTGVRMTYYQIDDPGALPVITNLPYTGDADGDGMPDAWETQFALLLHSDDRDMDSDNDGLTNLEEFQVGTDPTKGTSFFKATTETTADGLTITWNSVPNASYRILYTPDLGTPFEPVATVTADGPSCSHSLPRAGSTGFFRVEKIEVPPP